MELKLLNGNDQAAGKVDAPDTIFGREYNEALIHQIVVAFQANARMADRQQKSRETVAHTTKKPWRQKGTGRARQGSTRAPQWRHGGVALGPKPRSYRYSMNKKAKRLALKSAFSAKVAEGKFIVVDKLELAEIKTKSMIKVLDNLKVEDKALVVLEGANVPVVKSTKNIPTAKTLYVNTLNVYEILKYDTFIATKEAVNKIQEVYK